MKESVFIDTDVLLDVLAGRQEYLINSSKVLALCEDKKINGYTSSICIVNCIYILERLKIQNIKSVISKLGKIITILPCSSKDIDNSIASKFKDIEDGIQNSIAVNSGKCKVIITRNVKDFKGFADNVQTPNEFLETILNN